MNRILNLTSILIFAFSLIISRAYAAGSTYYVTQNGNGTKSGESLANTLSASDFNALRGTGYAGDTFYFSGKFSTRIKVGISGTSRNQVILDGWSEGTCTPLDSICTSSALLNYGMEGAEDIAYVTIQDFRMTKITSSSPTTIFTLTYGTNHIIIQNNYLYNAPGRIFQMSGVDDSHRVNHIIIRGNKFYNQYQADVGGENQAVTFLRVEYVLFKGNIITNDSYPYAYSDNAMTTHTTRYTLIENNDISGAPNQAAIAIKEHGNQNVIVRYNNIHGNGIAKTEGGRSIDLLCPYTYYIYIYGNRFYDNIAGTVPAYGVGLGGGPHDIWIWSNLFFGNQGSGIAAWREQYEGSYPSSYNIHVTNNTFSENVRSAVSASNGHDWVVKNNIFYKNSVSDSYRQVKCGTSEVVGNLSLDHNVYYYPGQIPIIYYDNANRTVAQMYSTYGIAKNSSTSNPDLSDPRNGDLTLKTGSPAIGTATDLSQQFQINLSGGDSWFEAHSGYSTVNIGLDEALDPTATNWKTIPPTVATVKRDKAGWSRGAYAHEGKTALAAPTGLQINIY